MESIGLNLPENFLLDITNISGSSDDVCIKAIQHYKLFEHHPDPIVQQISKAMIGNLGEYYNISHKGSFQFEIALPHLSDVANYMDSKNSLNMYVQSTARIKSFYSAYEKLLSNCAESIENNKPIPCNGFAKDLIATRDIFYPRFQMRNNPENFYKHVYATILDFMEYIDELSKKNPEYGFELVDPKKQQKIIKPKKHNYPEGSIISVPKHDFLGYALNAKGIPEVYRYLAKISSKLNHTIMIKDIMKLKNMPSSEIDDLPLIKTIQNELKKESLMEFRNDLEQEFLDSIPINSSMYKDYTTMNKDDFLYIHKLNLKPKFKDYLEIVSNIDTAISLNNYTTNFMPSTFAGGTTTEKSISSKLNILTIDKNLKLSEIIYGLNNLNLKSFSHDLKQAEKLAYYAQCSKDYMKNPKETGYQSFHVVVRTPFGRYEKQFRTEAQHNFAEYGHASHSNSYKPYEKENFHRLKVCTPLMPARNKEGDIIFPIRLVPLELNDAIKEYYHKDFSFFSGGYSMEQFKAMHPDDFDKAMLGLSQPDEKLLERVGKSFNFLQKIKQTVKKVFSDNPYDNR